MAMQIIARSNGMPPLAKCWVNADGATITEITIPLIPASCQARVSHGGQTALSTAAGSLDSMLMS